MLQIEDQPLGLFTNLVIVWELLVGIAENKIVALATCEADNQGVFAAVQEIIVLRPLLQDMFITPVKANPIAEDNQGCMNCPTTQFSIKKSKNTSTNFPYVQEKVENGSVEIFYQRTEGMAADIFRKALG